VELSNHRYSAKRDLNEPEIVTALIGVGALVQRLSEPLDLLVGYEGAFCLMEVKNPNASNPRLNDKQVRFIEAWAGYPVYVVYTIDEALRAIGAIEGRS
jgi:hypothetical protein